MLLNRPFKQHIPGQIYHKLYGESYDCAGCVTHPESLLKEKAAIDMYSDLLHPEIPDTCVGGVVRYYAATTQVPWSGHSASRYSTGRLTAAAKQKVSGRALRRQSQKEY